jgi:hypothetical protein
VLSKYRSKHGCNAKGNLHLTLQEQCFPS